MPDFNYESLMKQAVNPPPTPPAPVDNPYEQMMQQYKTASAQAAQGTTVVNAEANPDHAARAQELSQTLNIPPSVIESDLPTFEARAAAIKRNATINDNPMLASWVANNHEGARVANDDFDKLGAIDKTLRALETGASQAVYSDELGRLYNVKQLADQAGMQAPETDKQIAEYEKRSAGDLQLRGGYGFVQKASGFAMSLLDNFLHGQIAATAGAGAGAVVGAAAGGVGALPGAAAGYTLGSAFGFKADMARIAAGQNYRATANIRDHNGEPLSTTARNVGSLLTGVLTYAIAGVGIKSEGQMTDEAIAKFTSDAVNRALVRPTVGKALATISKAVVKGGVTGAALNLGMEGANLLGEELTKQISSGDFATVLNDPAQREQALNRLADAAANGALMFGTMHAIGGSIGLTGDLLRARQASMDVQMLKNLQDGAASSATRGRNRQVFQDFMQHQTQGTPVENLYLPVETVLKLYQGAKIDPNVERAKDPIFGWVKDMPQQLTEARAHGGDIVIPTADYVTHLAGTDIGNGLLNDVRVRPDAMSVNEAKQFQDTYRESLKTAAQEASVATQPAPHERVYQDVEKQARAAGYGASQARQYAALYAARYSARAARMGIDPWEAYQRSGVQIRAGEAVPRETMPIITSKDVPFAGGTDKAGTKVYIDRSIPQFLDIGGKKVDVHQLIAIHEEAEKPLLDKGIQYDEAHKQATAVEKKAVEAAGIDWKSYQAALRPFISRAEHENNPQVPHDLETKPYTEGETKGVAGKDEREVLAAQEKTFGQDAAPQQYGDTKKGVALTLTANTIPSEGQWRVTHWLDGQPVRHVPYESYPEALSEFERAARSENKYSKFFEQKEGEQQRGAITLTQGRVIINLFKDRDLSTLLHESSHLWLEELKVDAADPNSPQQLKDDLATALKYIGNEDPTKISVEQHEKFARAGEAYFMEGKAPSTALASVFQRFKAWLTHIYKTVSGLNSPINDELRSVFDRLIATDEEIQHAQQSIGIFSDQAVQKFRDSLSGLMTQAEFKAYMKSIDRANTDGNETLLAKMMEKVKRERTADWKTERDRVVEEVTPDIDARPEMQALQYMPKLDRKIIEKIYGGNPAMMYFLPKSLLAKEGGVHPDQAAEMFGFSSGDVMLKKLIEMEQEKRRMDVETGKNRSIRQHLIDQAVDAKMDEKYGDLLNSDSIREEALAAVHNRAQEEALATELKVMGRKTSQPGIPLEMARDWARETIGGKRVGDVTSLGRYARAEASAAKSSEMALLADKPQEAYLHKRQQILNHMLYRAATEAGAEIEKGEKLFDRLSGEKTFKSLDQDYVDRIHELLSRFDYRIPRTPDELARGLGNETLEGFVNRKFPEGYELAIDPMLYNPDMKGDVKQLTVGQFRALHDAVKSLQAVGRDENTIMVGGERTDRELAVAQMVSHLQSLPQKKPSDYLRPEYAGGLKAAKARTLARMRAMDASLLKEEQLLDWMDGNDPAGPFNKYIFRPLKEAQLRADDLRRKVATQIQDVMRSMPKGWAKDLTDAVPQDMLIQQKTGEPFILRRKDMLSMALNIGNADNAAKLADGYGWTEPAIMQFLHENMRQADWQFVQKMWDTVGQFRPDIDALQRRVTGVGIDFVQPRMVQTKFGDLAGGYFPIVYDPFRSPEAERHMAKAASEMFENQYYRATTPKGFTIKRVQGVQRPIALDLDIIPWKIGQVIHDLSYRESIMDAGKLLSDKRILAGIDDAFGHEYTQTLRPWLQSIANNRNIDDASMGGLDKFLNKARTNAVMVGIGFRLSTMFKHGSTALSNSFGELGPKWMMAGTKEFFGTPETMKKNYDFVMEKSGEMRNRIDHYDRDVRENLKSLLGENGFKAEAQRYAAYGVVALDQASALPTWLGAYRKALASEAEGGLAMNDADAVYYADKTVRKAHGSQGLVDLAAIQRGGELQKLLTMFYGFFNHIYNRQRDVLRQAGGAIEKAKQGNYRGAGGDFALVLARGMAYLIVPAMVEAMYTKGGPDDSKDEGWSKWASKAILAEIPAGIPVARDMAKAAIDGRGYEFSPVQRAFETVKGTVLDDLPGALGWKDKEPSKKWLRHAIETSGYVTGWPTGQAAVATQFIWDTMQGDQQPQDIGDFFHGISFGKVKANQ